MWTRHQLAIILLVVALCNSSQRLAPAQSANLKEVGYTTDGVVVVQLRRATMLDEPVVTIGAVANLRDGTAELRQQIADLDLAELSSVGKGIRLTPELVACRIQLAGIDLKCFRVEGAVAAVVTLATIHLTQEKAAEAAQKGIADARKADRCDVECRVIEVGHMPVLPPSAAGDLRLVPEVRGAANHNGRVAVNVAVLLKGEKVGVVPVTLDVACFGKVAVASRHLGPGESLQGDAVHWERIQVRGGEGYLSYTDKLAGQRTVREVPAGQVLTAADVEGSEVSNPILVKSRDSVRLVADVGGLSVTALGEALQDGRAGQVIHVRNTDSGRVVVGRVAGPCVVEVAR